MEFRPVPFDRRSAMPTAVHEWTRVDAGIWHSFHYWWAAELAKGLNNGLLPRPYYALAEPQTGFSVEDSDDAADDGIPEVWRDTPPRPARPDRREGDLLTLAAPARAVTTGAAANGEPDGWADVGEAGEPAAALVEDLTSDYPTRRLSIRHASGHRVVALVEFASPGNRNSAAKVDLFAGKIEEALLGGVHVLLTDLFPPNGPAPNGLHGAVLARFGRTHEPPPGKPLCCAAYRAGPVRRAYAEPLAVGDRPPTLPLFLTPDRHIPLDLAPSYAAAFDTVPWYWREVVEGTREHRPPSPRP